MIKNVGYTDDGLIIMVISADVGGQKGEIIINMTKETAADVSEWLAVAVQEAPEMTQEFLDRFKGVIRDERNRANLN